MVQLRIRWLAAEGGECEKQNLSFIYSSKSYWGHNLDCPQKNLWWLTSALVSAVPFWVDLCGDNQLHFESIYVTSMKAAACLSKRVRRIMQMILQFKSIDTELQISHATPPPLIFRAPPEHWWHMSEVIASVANSVQHPRNQEAEIFTRVFSPVLSKEHSFINQLS